MLCSFRGSSVSQLPPSFSVEPSSQEVFFLALGAHCMRGKLRLSTVCMCVHIACIDCTNYTLEFTQRKEISFHKSLSLFFIF